MNLTNKNISVIIPMYNAEKYIVETLNSVLLQTYTYWECIIVDDGSTDKSSILVADFCKKDNRFKYLRQENAGPSRARNLGLKNASGDYIQFLDADDVFFKERFYCMLNAYVGLEEENVILYSNLVVGENDNIFNTSKFSFNTTLGYDVDFDTLYLNFVKKILFVPGCILFPRECLKDCVWDESLSQAEDLDFYLQITKKNNFVFRNISTSLLYYRNTTNSLSSNLLKIYKANYIILEKYRTLNNIFDYCQKVGFFLYRNLINYRKKKIVQFVSPIDFKNKRSLLSTLLFPISIIYCLVFFIPTKNK